MIVRHNHFDRAYPQLAWTPALGGFDFLRRELDRLFFRDDSPVAQAYVDNCAAPQEFSVKDEGSAYVVTAQLPGIRESELDVTVTGRTLTIAAERKSGVPEGYTAIRRERKSYRLERAIQLPTVVDSTRIEAQLASGLLTIKLPKAEEPKAQRVQVKAL